MLAPNDHKFIKMYTTAQQQNTIVPQGQLFPSSDLRFIRSFQRNLPKHRFTNSYYFDKAHIEPDYTYVTPSFWQVGDRKFNLFDQSITTGFRFIMGIADHVCMKKEKLFNVIVHKVTSYNRTLITIQEFYPNGKFKTEYSLAATPSPVPFYYHFQNLPNTIAHKKDIPQGKNKNDIIGLEYDINNIKYYAGQSEPNILDTINNKLGNYYVCEKYKFCIDQGIHRYVDISLLHRLVYDLVVTRKCCLGVRKVCNCVSYLTRPDGFERVREQIDVLTPSKRKPVESVTQEIDDFGADLKTSARRTHNSSNPTCSVTATSALNMIDTPMSIQALETVNVTTGNERNITTLTTPDGPRDVIHLANTSIKPNSKIPYMPSTFLPTAAYVWNLVNTTTSSFNARVAHYMTPYGEYHCQYLFRIIAKPSLFSNARVWVSLNSSSTVGFEWSPAEENEVYVLVPWQDVDLTRPTSDITTPVIKITDLSSVVYAEGTATTIDYSVFVAPFNMFLYRPIPVPTSDPVVPPTSLTSTTSLANPSSVTISGGSGLVSCVAFTRTSGALSIISGTTTILVFNTVTLEYTSTRHEISGLEFISATGVSGHVIRVDHDSSATVTFGYPALERVVEQIAEIPNTIHSKDNPSGFVVEGEGYAVGTVSYVDGSGIDFNYMSLGVIGYGGFAKRSCGEVETPLRIFTKGKYTFAAQGVWEEFSVSIHPVDCTVTFFYDEVEEQIMELSYNENFKDNQKIIGKPGPHTVHVDSHWDFLSKSDFNTNTDSKYIPISVSNSSRSKRDFQKYNQYSKYPVIQFSAASIPTSNVLFRITQDPFPATASSVLSDINSALELPGVEWDPKTGPLYLQPYWDCEYPTRYTDDPHVIGYHMHILAGTVVEPVSVVAKVNYRSVEYHNYFINHSSYTALETVVEQIEEFEPSNTVAGTETVGADSAVNLADDVEVEVSSTFVAPIDDQTQEKVTGIASRFEFVHSTTITPQTAVFWYAINHNMLGRDAFDEYIGYEYWTGKPVFKLAFSCGSATAADAHVVQVPPSVDPTTLTYAQWVSLVKSRPSGAVSVRDGSYEVEMEWMAPEIRTSRNQFLGYLAVVMPFSNQDGTAPQYLPTEILISLFTDAGNVSFTIDRLTVGGADDIYTEPLFETLDRPAAIMSKHRQSPLRSYDSVSKSDLVMALRELLGSGLSFIERDHPRLSVTDSESTPSLC